MAVSLLFCVVLIVFVLLVFHKQGLLSAFNVFSKGAFNSWQSTFIWTGSILLFLSFWDFLSKIEPEGINKIPSPIQTLEAAWHLISSGQLPDEALISCLRILIGFSIPVTSLYIRNVSFTTVASVGENVNVKLS